jgi:superfamily II DNA or RNA helicase
MRELRADQSEALESLRQSVANGKRRIVLQCPTGWGKTVLAAALGERARAKGRKVLFTVPALSLIDQTVEMFYAQGMRDLGVIQATHHMTDWSQPVQIASVQTLKRRPLPDTHVVLLDEIHQWHKAYETWLHADTTPAWANVPVIGLSATPWTRGLADWFDDYVRASTTQELIDQGLLSPFKVYAPSHPDLSGVRTVLGDYHEGELAARMSQQKLVADAVETWCRLGENRPTLCYAVNCAHAKHLQEKFQQAGVACEYQDANTRSDERAIIRAKFHRGEVQVVCNVGTLTTGIDWDVRCISLCRPTKSDMLFVQIVGRGLRTAAGKDHCLILDHSDNHIRLGFVTDIDASYTGLLGGKTPAHEARTEGIALPKECPACAHLKPPRTATCPACGFTTKAQNRVAVEAGELRELRPRAKPPKGQTRQALEAMGKMRLFAELKGYAVAHGYKSGWAAHKYREFHGVWPHYEIKHVPASGTVSEEVRSWVKSRVIAWARSGGQEASP